MRERTRALEGAANPRSGPRYHAEKFVGGRSGRSGGYTRFAPTRVETPPRVILLVVTVTAEGEFFRARRAGSPTRGLCALGCGRGFGRAFQRARSATGRINRI